MIIKSELYKYIALCVCVKNKLLISSYSLITLFVN